jgi:N-acyl-D-amino-acid deacylase
VFDVLIAGGDVYDGCGAGPVPADVGVCGDRVVAVGRGLPREAAAVVDAAGKAVCPGFINILSHSNLSIDQHVLRPAAESRA